MPPFQIEQTPTWVQDLFSSEWAFFILFGLCILEGLMMLRFMPTELLIPSAIYLIGSSIPTVILILIIAVIGTTIGQIILFLLLRKAGREFVIQSRLFPVGEERLEKFDTWFNQWGTIAVPVTNTMLFVRGLMTFPAGLSDMNWKKFALLSAAGSTSFQSILAGLYLFADQVLV